MHVGFFLFRVKTAENAKVAFSGYSAVLILSKHTYDHKRMIKNTEDVQMEERFLENQGFEELHLSKMEKIQIGLNTYVYTATDQALQDTRRPNMQSNFVKGFPVLESFAHGEDDFLYENNYGFKFFSKRGSAVLKQYASGTYYTFKELLNIQDEILMNPQNATKYQHQKFMVRGFILATEYDYIFRTAKIYSPSLNKV